MVTSVVRECSIYRTGIVLKTKRNLIAVPCVMGHHIPKTTIPYQTPPPSISRPHFKPKCIEIVSFHTDTISSGKDTVLKKHSTSIFRQSREDASSIFLWNTTAQTICYPHYVSSPLWKPEAKNLEILMKKVDGLCWRNCITSTTLCSLATQYLMPWCWAPLLCYSFFYLLKWNKKVKRYNKIKSSQPFKNAECWEFYICRGICSQHNYPTHMQFSTHKQNKYKYIYHQTWHFWYLLFFTTNTMFFNLLTKTMCWILSFT